MERHVSKDSDGAEAALFSGEQDLRLLVETIPTLVWRARPDGNIEYVNKRVLDYFGAPLGEITGWRWAERVHPDDVAFKVKSWLENLETENPHDVACRFRGADGRYRWFNVRGAPLKASDGHVLRWYGVLIDIDDQKRAEEALRESEYKLRQIFETVPGLLWSADPAGDPTQINQRLVDYTGMRLEDIQHGGWEAFLHPDDFPETARAIQHAIQTGTSYQAVHRLRRAGGEFRWHHARGEPLRDPQGRIVQWYGLSVDIDEAKRAEDRLRRSEALLAEAERLSHSGASAANESTILYFSEEAYRIWGFDPALGIPSPEAMFQRIHPDDRDRARATAERLLSDKKGYSHGYRIVLPDGTVKHIESIREPVFSPSGELVEIVATQIDVTERQRAEEALRDSEYKLRQILETVPGLIWLTDPNGNPTYVNQRILDYIGAPFEEFVGRGWEAFIHPDDRPETENAFRQAIQTGTSHEIVHRLRRSDGAYRWHHTRSEPMRDQQGSVIQWYGLSVDVDEAKRAEDLLRRSEAILAAAQRLSHSGASAYNGSAVLYWSEGAYRIWGFDPAQGIPDREAVFQRVHPDDRDRMRADIDRVLVDPTGSSNAFRIVLPDGTVRHLESIREPVFSASGEFLEIVSAQLDVTERKRAEQALRESEYKLRQIIETVPSLVWSLDPDGEPTHYNQRMLDYFGKRYEDFTQGGWGAFVHPDDLPEAEKAFLHDIRAGVSHQAVLRLRRADGEFRWHQSRCEPLRDQQGRIVQWYGLSIDIDDAKKAEDRLRRSEAYLAEAQRISHSGVAAYNETKVLYGSEEIYRIWGFDPAQGVPSLEAVFQRIHPDDRDGLNSEVQRAVAEKRGYSHEYRIVLPDGTVKHLEVIGQPAFSSIGELVEIVTTQIDVTERKRAEDRLRRSEAHLAEAQSLSHTGSTVYNEKTILYWSDETYRIYGFDPALGIPSLEGVFQRIHPDDRDRARVEFERAFSEKRSFAIELRIVLPDGTVKNLKSISRPVFSADGRLVEFVGTNIDLTERKQAEEALRESEHALRQLFETVPGLLWSVDPAGEPTQLNQRMLDYTGMRFEDFKHGGWGTFLHPDDFPETARAFRHAVQTGTPFQSVFRLRRADGEFRWHHARGEPLRDRKGRIVQWYGLSVDIDEGKRAEDLLRRSEAYLAEAQSLSHTGSAAFNDTVILYWSDETYRIFGLDPRNGVPSREAVVQAIHPDDLERVLEEARRAVLQKRDYKLEYRIVLPVGITKHIEVTSHPKFSESGDLVEVVSTIVDVTERKSAQQALRESEYKLRQLMDTVPGLTWSTGQPGFMAQVQAILNVLPAYTWYGTPSGSLIFVNTRQADFLGVPNDHPLRFGIDTGAPWDVHIPFLHPDDQQDGRKLWSNSLRTGEGYEHNYRVRTAQGDYRWFHTRTEPLRASDGTLLLWVGATLDIEELKRAEEDLRESEAKFRDYAESASDWFWEIGTDYKFTLLTENAFGSDSADRIGTAYWDRALDLETEPEKWRLLRATLDARKPFRDFVYYSARRNGSPIHVKVTGKPVFDADGQFRGYRGTGTDVTAFIHAQEEHERLRQLESDLAHMNRVSVIGELTASLAHEITQPIAAGRNNARAAMHFLDRNPPDLGEIREALASIVDDADRAGNIIDRIRDHIKKAPPRKSRFDLNKAIDEVIGLAQSAIATNGVAVRTRLTEALSPIEGDRVQLQQVVMNLILNAVEAMSTVEAGPRELVIGTEQTQTGDVLVSVHDTGPGIDPDRLDRVFEAFYTTKSSGVGMGLSISQSIIDAHGGRLWADMNASHGAVLRFFLPGAGNELRTSRRSARRTG
ncbi:PAS domain-containing protein (plasmid) [Mesorhizobium sp. ISC25]|uniref:PAS domain-containing protein n=1 Tax=Mesorhizobium sp. ISC25 TaxID=3077335 RepID=UPI0035DE7EF2